MSGEDPFDQATKSQIKEVGDQAIAEALEANDLGKIAKARDLYDGAKNTADLVNKVNEIGNRPAEDLTMKNLRPAGDLANLIESIPFIGSEYMPVMSTL